jgi:hypothetical protein
MKTTIDIQREPTPLGLAIWPEYSRRRKRHLAGPILDAARKLAAREGTTLRSFVERGLRHVLSERKRTRRSFKLRDASVKGGGWLRPELRDAGWDRCGN